MDHWTIIGAIVCIWAALRTIGNERQRELQRARAEAEAAARRAEKPGPAQA